MIQDSIDMCVERCPWPDNPAMCEICGGRPERVRQDKKPRTMTATRERRLLIRAAILWLEWRAKQPDNPNPGRTREILRGVMGW